MKKQTMCLVVLVATIALLVLGGLATASNDFPDASNDRRVTLSWGSTTPAEDLATNAMKRVAELVQERSGGSLRINVFPASQLGTAMTQMEMTMDGNIDMFIEGGNYMADWGVKDSAIASILFLCPSRETFLRLIDSDLYKSWQAEFLETTGLRTLASNWMRPTVEFASNVELRTFEDFHNLKIRTIPSEYTMAAMKAVGMNPTAVAYDEVYLAMQQGVIDATISTLDTIYTMNFYQVSKYVNLVHSSYVNFGVWINDRKYNSLTAAQQEILSRTCIEVGDWYCQAVNDELQSYVDKMIEHGIEFIEYSPEERAKFTDAVQSLVQKYEQDGLWSTGLVDQYMEIMAE